MVRKFSDVFKWPARRGRRTALRCLAPAKLPAPFQGAPLSPPALEGRRQVSRGT
jgi:hypothetical protein